MKLNEVEPGKDFEGVCRISYKDKRQKSNGEPFLVLSLEDETGQKNAKVWDGVEELDSRFNKGDVVRVRGTVDSWQGTPQINVKEMKPASAEETEVLMPRSPRPLEEMEAEWEKLVALVENPHLRSLLDAVWEDEVLKTAFTTLPAGTMIHHPYKGGLLEHSLAVAKGAYLLWRKVYPHLHRDLLISGGLLHDIGKSREITWVGTVAEYTDQGRLLGHVVLGNEILARLIGGIQGFPPELAMKLQHIVASHHGEPEVGAATVPQSQEAVMIHFLDELDSKVAGFKIFIERDENDGQWTAYHRWFNRYIYKG